MLAPRKDALLAEDVAAVELDGRVVLIVADGAALLAALHHLRLGRLRAHRKRAQREGHRRRRAGLPAVEQRDELEGGVQVRA